MLVGQSPLPQAVPRDTIPEGLLVYLAGITSIQHLNSRAKLPEVKCSNFDPTLHSRTDIMGMFVTNGCTLAGVVNDDGGYNLFVRKRPQHALPDIPICGQLVIFDKPEAAVNSLHATEPER